MLALRGVFGPVVSNFGSGSEDLDLAAFRANIRAHVSAGLAGVLVCGSTGEATLLSEDERRAVLDAARAESPAGRLVLMGVGAESTRLTIERSKDAKRGGADAVLVVAPHYYSNAMTPEALRTHYRRVADASPLPVALYNIPKYMHFKLLPELVAELAQHENIIGIKDSSGDLELLAGYLQSRSETFTVLTGNAGQIAPAIAAGAGGGIVAVSLFAGAQCVAVYEAAARGDAVAAEALQAPLRGVAAQVVGELGVPGVKAALEAVGMAGGTVRGPLLNLNAERVAKVRSVLTEAGIAVLS